MMKATSKSKDTMKKPNQEFCILVLVGLLFLSLVLSFLQGNRIEQLTHEVIELREYQSYLESHVNELHQDDMQSENDETPQD